MHTPSHLARPDDDRTYYLPPGRSIESLLPAPVPVLDRSDQIFIELISLRRQSVRLAFWQVARRRRIDARVKALLAEQASL